MNECKECECQNNRETRESLTKKIMEYKFAIIDISLYLNAHPNDNRATIFIKTKDLIKLIELHGNLIKYVKVGD